MGQNPAINGWKQAATTDPERIRAWWRDLPRALGVPGNHLIPGIWCDHPDLNFVVVDADRHGGPDGVAEVDALVAQHGLPIGPVDATAGDGFHYIFRQPDGDPLGNHEGVLRGRGINIRGHSSWVVAPGSVRPDGAMWRTAKGSPSLIEAFRKNSILQLPTWLVDMIRTKPEKAPRDTEAEPQARTSPSTAPSSSTHKASRETCEKWAATALEGNAAELAAAKSGCRNNLTNIVAYRMGRMVAPGCIAERTVVDAFTAACEANGKILGDGEPEPIRATIESGLAAGRRKPLTGLPDRPRQPWQPIDGNDDNMWLRGLRSELRALHRMRFPGNPAAVDEADRRLWEVIRITANPYVIGEELRLTFEEYQRLASEPHGRQRARLPAKMKPANVSRQVVEAYLKERKRTADRIYRANPRAKERPSRMPSTTWMTMRAPSMPTCKTTPDSSPSTISTKA